MMCMICLAHVTGCQPYDLHDLPNVSSDTSVFHIQILHKISERHIQDLL